jgi:hypothetical protein
MGKNVKIMIDDMIDTLERRMEHQYGLFEKVSDCMRQFLVRLPKDDLHIMYEIWGGLNLQFCPEKKFGSNYPTFSGRALTTIVFYYRGLCLTNSSFIGLIAHEFGHMVCYLEDFPKYGKYGYGEDQANEVAKKWGFEIELIMKDFETKSYLDPEIKYYKKILKAKARESDFLREWLTELLMEAFNEEHVEIFNDGTWDTYKELWNDPEKEADPFDLEENVLENIYWVIDEDDFE